MYLFSLLLGCDCDNIPAALSDIPNPSCKPRIGQIQRYWFVRGGEVIWDSVTPANNVPVTIASDLIEEAAGWAVLFAAVNSTKVVKTPLTGGNSGINGGEPITEGGGGDDTLNGVTLINGFTPSNVQMDFIDLTAAQIEAMRKLFCEGDLEVYMVNNEGKILHKDVAGIKTGFPIIGNVVLSPKLNVGITQRDRNTISFSIENGWDANLAFATPVSPFNPLTV
jgi:hypothetical protein